MRQMINEHGTTVNVIAYVRLFNGCEYYVMSWDMVVAGPGKGCMGYSIAGSSTPSMDGPTGYTFVSYYDVQKNSIDYITELDETLPPEGWNWHDEIAKPFLFQVY
ncbi:TPA: hypothetical protein DHW51_14560 [Candidatus Poribacteria bacterium]|nr:hypothetical protein [Candidatus Poribacteria bacterium]